MPLPRLPPRAAYLRIDNPGRRNALSLSVLRSLQSQLVAYNTSRSGLLRLLPPFKPSVLGQLENGSEEVDYLTNGQIWRREREGLPSVIVLRSEGPVFSSGHDLSELRSLSHDEVQEAFALCANVMNMIRRSPAPVVCAVQGALMPHVSNEQQCII